MQYRTTPAIIVSGEKTADGQPSAEAVLGRISKMRPGAVLGREGTRGGRERGEGEEAGEVGGRGWKEEEGARSMGSSAAKDHLQECRSWSRALSGECR